MEVSKQFISKVLLPNYKITETLFTYSNNKFIEDYVFSLDRIPLDYDICSIHDYWNTNNSIINLDLNVIKRINKFCKNNNISVFCYIFGNNTIGI